jgi:hypothetical protein
MALASVALKSARVFLGDINGITWPDTILLPILQEAHSELVQELEKFSLPIILHQSCIILVPAGARCLGSNQPDTLVEPISIMERIPGTDMEDFELMIRMTFIPTVDLDEDLTYWAWQGQQIKFLGATQDREIILRYKGSVATPQTLNDPLGFTFAERYIGPRIASIAWDSVGKDGKKFQTLAENNLYKIVQSNVTNDQRPVRRKGYRTPKDTGPEGARISGIITVQGPTVTWLPTTTPPDGIRTEFFFTKFPKYVSWNGLNQFEGIGYTLNVYPTNAQPVGPLSPGYSMTYGCGVYSITFLNSLNLPIAPVIGDDIRAETGSVELGIPIHWVYTLTPPDGVRTSFDFPAKPNYVSWNGLNQFLAQYLTTQVVGRFSVTFIDNLGNPAVPAADDDIREEIS